MTEQAPIAPWYRQPWFWFLTIFPLAAIVVCTALIITATNLRDPMVTDDYSKEGRGINMELARDSKAVAMGMSAKMNFEQRHVSLELNTDNGSADFPYLILNLFHPTLAERDRIIQFQRTGIGHYEGQLLDDIDGRWYYDLRGPDNDWRLKGETWLPSEHAITVRAEGAAKG